MTTDSSVITKAFFLYLRIRQGNKQYRSKGKIFFLFVTFFKFYETFFCKEKKKKNLFKIFSLKSNFLISYLDESNFFCLQATAVINKTVAKQPHQAFISIARCAAAALYVTLLYHFVLFIFYSTYTFSSIILNYYSLFFNLLEWHITILHYLCWQCTLGSPLNQKYGKHERKNRIWHLRTFQVVAVR